LTLSTLCVCLWLRRRAVQLSSLASLPFSDAEIVPYLTLCFMEGWPSPVKGEVPGPVAELAIQVHTSGVSNHPHHAVALSYLEMTKHLASVFKRHPEYCLPVAQSLLGPTCVTVAFAFRVFSGCLFHALHLRWACSGIMHPHLPVRARASYVFCCLVKDVIVSNDALAHPLVQPIVSLVQVPCGV
jgi:hypothetical protein